jgi:hypothetical protein
VTINSIVPVDKETTCIRFCQMRNFLHMSLLDPIIEQCAFLSYGPFVEVTIPRTNMFEIGYKDEHVCGFNAVCSEVHFPDGRCREGPRPLPLESPIIR